MLDVNIVFLYYLAFLIPLSARYNRSCISAEKMNGVSLVQTTGKRHKGPDQLTPEYTGGSSVLYFFTHTMQVWPAIAHYKHTTRSKGW